ncbi:hypothetical protein PsYK624_099480 [Phanerochaete sordida]|uniref:Uncharacterized protein n=1 Tax=Phanerochaete sordida TaxID=48140 RepID=A0A9P3GF51_9APHY|nr:hypothetical protein PsYK624_099480 [Phanerochaete sordida]
MSAEIMTEEIERSPSRMGFTRPPLRVSSDFEYADAVVEDDDEKWEFAGALLVPSSSTSSDSSDDLEPSDATVPEHKPALPSRTISLSHIPMQFPVVSEPAEVDAHYHVAIPVTTSASDTVYAPEDHGLSRSALAHLKGFWDARLDEYKRLKTQLVLETNPYGGILEASPRDGLRAALFSRLSRPGLHSPQDASPSRDSPPSLNAPIYPRTGDLSTLHDSRSAVLDRAFRNLTLNSINKILFLHDMLQRANGLSAARPSKSAQSEDDDFVDVSLTGTGTVTSSESAFVAASPLVCQQPGCESGACKGQHEAEPSEPHDRTWEVDWIVRWKVLLARVKEDSLLPTQSPSPSPVDEKAFWAAFNPPKPAKFFIHEEHDEFFGLDSASEDEDDDYGAMVTQSSWGLSAESLSREFLHNLCEYRLSLAM